MKKQNGFKRAIVTVMLPMMFAVGLGLQSCKPEAEDKGTTPEPIEKTIEINATDHPYMSYDRACDKVFPATFTADRVDAEGLRPNQQMSASHFPQKQAFIDKYGVTHRPFRVGLLIFFALLV
jgi:hypothetical protein